MIFAAVYFLLRESPISYNWRGDPRIDPNLHCLTDSSDPFARANLGAGDAIP